MIAGPYAGELGWELMQWQGYVRRLRPFYARTIVVSYAGHEYLYEGCEFVAHDRKLEASGFHYGLLSEAESADTAAAVAAARQVERYDHLAPHMLDAEARRRLGTQDFRIFRAGGRHTPRCDVLFHFRSLVRRDGRRKNYPARRAAALVRRCVRAGYRVGCVGLPGSSLCPSPALDLRSHDLRSTVAALSRARLVVGGSSGAMHLASLCAKPIVVWASRRHVVDRYLTSWNPHASPAWVVSRRTFRPRAVDVFGVVRSALTSGRGLRRARGRP